MLQAFDELRKTVVAKIIRAHAVATVPAALTVAAQVSAYTVPLRCKPICEGGKCNYKKQINNIAKAVLDFTTHDHSAV